MRTFQLAAIALVATVLVACSKKPTQESSSAQPSAAVAAVAVGAVAPSNVGALASAAPASSTAIPPVDPVCKVESKRVWVSGVNKLTGLTEAKLADGRIAIGFAQGVDPHILLVNANAHGNVVKVPIAKTSRLASVPKGTERYLARVTPVKVEGENIKAFVDYEDHQLKDKKRSIICGPADANENWVEYEGQSYFARKDAKPAELAGLFHQEGTEKVYDELHSCRTFTNLDQGQTWVLGSNLHGVLQADNSVKWRSDFFVTTAPKGKRTILESTEINNKTIEDEHYEVPVSHAMKTGNFLVAARHRSHLIVGILGPDKALSGKFARYPGFPTLPDLEDEAGDALVLSTSFAKGKGEFGLRAMRIHEEHPELPKALQVVVTDKNSPEIASESDPDFARDASGQRWLAHIEGTRGNGALSLAPLDKDFKAMGRSYTVTEGSEKAIVARLVPLKDGGLLVVFLRENDKELDLVSEEVHCKIEK